MPGAVRDLPLPALVMLIAIVVAGALALLVGAGTRKPARVSRAAIADAVREADCTLQEFDGPVDHNPPVTGRFSERDRAADGSYVGRRSPSPAAAIHALFHGRVLIQYRPDLPQRQIRRLQRLVSADSGQVLLFANQTGMRPPVAATSYLSVMTCPRVDPDALRALRAYRNGRRGFGQAF
jgi:hypothetical protein